MSRRKTFHEDFGREETLKRSSDRGFGLVFAAACALVGSARWWRGHPGAGWWLAAAAFFLLAALLKPTVLAPLNRLWLGLGLLLYRVVNPVVMAVLFYLCVTPIGLLMRALGKDFLALRYDPGAAVYWIERRPPGPAPETMQRQF